MIIATDFDGTMCESAWPHIGKPKWDVLKWLKTQKASGSKLILWTCRHGDMLREAVGWSAEMGIFFDAVNENLPEIIKRFGFDTRKVFADVYLDDKNMNVATMSMLPVPPTFGVSRGFAKMSPRPNINKKEK